MPQGVDWTPVDEALTMLQDRLKTIVKTETISVELSSFLEEKEMPVLAYQSENLKESYLNFYADLISAN